MKVKRLLALLLALLLVLGATGCACEHEWLAATCTAPETCKKCHATQGEALGHQWEAATCQAPETCKRCGETQGTALKHEWSEATCTTPKTCSSCGATEGAALGHQPGEWELDEPDYISGTVWERQNCTRCGENIDLKLMSFPMQKDGHFQPSPKEFSERLGRLLEYVPNCSDTARFVVTDDGTMGCTIMNGTSIVATVIFNDDEGFMDGDQSNARNTISSMICSFNDVDTGEVALALIGVILTCDVSLEVSDAKEIAQSATQASLSGEPVEHNGIKYALGLMDGNWMLVVSVLT